MRFFASLSSADSVGATADVTPSSMSAFFNKPARHDSQDSEVLCDLAQRRFVLASDRDDIASELERVRLGHGDILAAKTNLQRSGVNQTRGSPQFHLGVSVVESAAGVDPPFLLGLGADGRSQT